MAVISSITGDGEIWITPHLPGIRHAYDRRGGGLFADLHLAVGFLGIRIAFAMPAASLRPDAIEGTQRAALRAMSQS
ncbi:hypothetical protein [Paraburkholderia terrae]|uniref:Uncharacterized protein n=1 Tax=Paraburkholderia terrae TaxID=311230 RepID=A0ABM7U217_9BURK|nr:hypothetical protein [Paraburkholderia terrae]BCZ85319.1 hypothetical protein PTKU64_89940 [Paraburkholderia terrae]BDC45622.1 hypothetical protein PTKU15_89190 [Paraburkholderia terrae]